MQLILIESLLKALRQLRSVVTSVTCLMSRDASHDVLMNLSSWLCVTCEHIQKSYACSLLSVSFNSENLTICFRYPVRCDISCYVSYDASKFE